MHDDQRACIGDECPRGLPKQCENLFIEVPGLGTLAESEMYRLDVRTGTLVRMGSEARA